MEKKDFDIKQGIKAHLIKTDLFKTNMVSVIITVPLTRENVTKNALMEMFGELSYYIKTSIMK